VTWMLLLLLVAGIYRTARMLAQEDGPFDAFARMRAAAGQANWFGRGLHCFMCLSWWIAGLTAVVLVLAGRAAWADVWYLWPGLAGLAVVMYQVVR
jgi:hypothetical protein